MVLMMRKRLPVKIRSKMDWERYYLIVVCMMLFVLSVHIFTFDQQVVSYSKHRSKRDTTSSLGNDTILNPNVSATTDFDDTTQWTEINGNNTLSSQMPFSITDVDTISEDSANVTQSPPFSLNSTDVTVTSSQSPSTPEPSVSLPNVPDIISTKVPNDVEDGNVTSEPIAQTITAADSNATSVINTTTSSATTQPVPILDLTTEGIGNSTEDAVVVYPQTTKIPEISSSTSTTSPAVLITDDVDEKKESLNLLAIVLPVAILLVLVIVFIIVVCCRYGNIICAKCRSQGRRGTKKNNGNDLWAEDQGIDNIAAMPDEEDSQTEKNSEVDSVVISAQMYGGKLYQVDYGFQASDDSHIGLAPGTIVEVVEKLDSGWWRGYVGDNDGWFPATYVHTLEKRQQNPDTRSDINQGFDIEEELRNIQEEQDENSLKINLEDLQSSPVSLQDKLMRAISEEANKRTQYVAIADYAAVNPDELSITKGEVLSHMNKDPSGWTQVKRNGSAESGWVPSSYIQQNLNDDDVFREDGNDETVKYDGVEEYYTDEELDETVDWEAEFDQDQDELTGIEHHAIHMYQAQQEGDLSFDAGDTVIVFEMLANGWWRGCSAGQEGWFPATYVEAVAQTPREGDTSSSFQLSLVPEPKRVTIHTENNVEYPDSAASSLERRMKADRHEKENDPLFSPSLSAEDKPVVPVRFVTPKLVRVNRGTLSRSAHKLRRPRRPAPAPPAGVEPYRTLTRHSMPRSRRKPPPPPIRTSPTKAYPSKPPPPPQRHVATKLKIPKGTSSSSTSPIHSPVESPVNTSPGKPSRPAPSRPAPPSTSILQARKQSIDSLGSSNSFIPPPVMFMDTIQKKQEAKEKLGEPPKPAAREAGKLNKERNGYSEGNAAHQAMDNSLNTMDKYASIDSKDSGSSWGQGSTLDKKDRPVMAVKPVMKFVQGDVWKQDIKRTSSSGLPHSTPSTNLDTKTNVHATTTNPVSANTMRVAPQPKGEKPPAKPKTRPKPPPRKSISQSSIPLQDIRPNSPEGKARTASRPSTSSTDSLKPAPPRPPPPRPAGPPPVPGQVVMRNKGNSPDKNKKIVKRASTLRRAAHSYQTNEKGHLNFQEDSFIKEMGDAPGKPGWMVGMLADGTTGIYPKDRVEEISAGVRISRV